MVLGTGGTIAGRSIHAGDNLGYTAGEVAVAQLLEGIPSLRGVPLCSEQVAQIDSKDMGPAVWHALALRCAHWLAQDEVGGIVITHGTDTLEETAYFLHAVLAPSKPVVLTCAMRPATALVPDGPQNIADAVTVASDANACGVVAVCAGVIHGARDVRKVHPYRLDAFSSGDEGALGYVEEGRLRMVRAWPSRATVTAADRLPDPAAWPQVEIVTSHAGATGAVVDALLAHGIGGLVVAGTGNGTIHQNIEAALRRAQQRGVNVIRATRCEQGRVLPHGNSEFPHSDGLMPVKARIALMLELMGTPPGAGAAAGVRKP